MRRETKRPLREIVHDNRRRFRFWSNRLKMEYGLRHKGRFFQIVIPSRYRKYVQAAKYVFGIIGLLSAYFVFHSAHFAFVFGVALFLVSWLLESTVFSHVSCFLHALPAVHLDPDKWVGMGFGEFNTGTEYGRIPVVSFLVTQKEEAKQIADLLLKWTNDEEWDIDRNVVVSMVVTKPGEYIFLCRPSLKRPVAIAALKEAEKNLRKSSLEDTIVGLQGMLVLGKRCREATNSYFPSLRKNYVEGTPVALSFVDPSGPIPKEYNDIPDVIVFDFSIKEKMELTRKDFEFEAIGRFEMGGEWQGPQN